MKKIYVNEREGQIDFFENFRIDYINNEVLIDNSDGVWNGNLLEFKTDIDNLNKVLFQAIKYLSKMRVKGESVPSNILLISLNSKKIYLYHSADYFEDIHKIYSGGASKNNDNFVGKSPIAEYDYSNTTDTIEVINLLKSCDYMPIRLDENCIVGWAERYYRDYPKASKGAFLGDDTGKIRIVGEIREPKHFKGLIIPYEGKTNEKFKYLMDKLNDRLNKKDLGAFYTPIPYAEKSAELVRMAIARVPKGNDYIILDRCAGTGNLESVLTDEELSHCILSTYEYYEYKVLCERLSDKVRTIIPPTEDTMQYSNGFVLNADAMSEEYINNNDIRKYIDNPNCTIILFENPPYRDAVADNNKREKTGLEKSFVVEEFKKELPKLPNSNISTARDLSNQFIWTALKYYLRQETDSYVLFSPIKYWKSLGLMERQFVKGFLFNRNHFHASPSGLACILWANIKKAEEVITLQAIDIDTESNEQLVIGSINIKKAHSSLNGLMDMRHLSDDVVGAVYCEGNGEQTRGRKCDGQSYWNENIIGYLNATGFSIDAKHVSLLRSTYFGIRGGYLRKDNYLKQIPLFVAKEYSQDKWFNRDIYFTTADGGDRYTKDKEFLKYCLFYTCLSNQNKCLSFHGTDNREYQNELCFEEQALAYKDLQKFKADIGLNSEEEELLQIWSSILQSAKATKNYDSHWNYGVYQITKELNTTHPQLNSRGKEEQVYDYPLLNGDLVTLRNKLKEYYKKYITPKMFEYELIK